MEKVSFTGPIEYHSYANFPGYSDAKNPNQGRKTKRDDIGGLSEEAQSMVVEETDQCDYFEEYIFTRFLSTWGSPFISVADGEIDIARAKKFLNGNFIIFSQNDFWRNKYLGSNESNQPNNRAKTSINLLYNFLNILKTLGQK